MYLTSYEFLLFLLVCFVVYYVIPKKFQWFFLLIASYIFYITNGIFYPIFLIAVSIVTYVAAIVVENRRERDVKWLKEHKAELSREDRKAFKEKSGRATKNYMLLGTLICLAILCIFKYSNFIIDNLNVIMQAFSWKRKIDTWNLILPLGISFYTFQSLGYLFDVYFEKIKAERNLLKHMLFVSFFPQLIQGPISRYSDVAGSMFAEHDFDAKQVTFGLERILWGFFKKLVVADTIASAVKFISNDPAYYDGAWVLVGIVFYAVQLYSDFSGGIDITIGIAEVFGITLPENFIRPFFSTNIAEFWRSWHITMGTWFRDYIFYPMSISDPMNHLTQKCTNRFGKTIGKRIPVYIATMVTWLATGIWHGASWNFVIWGVLNGVVLLLSQELKPLYEKFHGKFPKLVKSKGYLVFQIIRTFLLMGVLRMLDCYRDASATWKMFISMFRDFKIRALTVEEFVGLDVTAAQYIIVLAGCVVMLAVSLLSIKGSVREQIYRLPYTVKAVIFTWLFVAVLLFGSYGYGFDAEQFIYNQF